MQQDRITIPSLPESVIMQPRMRIRELREEAIRTSNLIQGAVSCSAVGATFAAVLMRAATVGLVIGLALMSIVAANALFVQSSILGDTRPPLFALGQVMTRSRMRGVRSIGRALRIISAFLPLWAGGTATFRRLRMAIPYRIAARRAAPIHTQNTRAEVVHSSPVSSRRNECLSPIAATHIALGSSAYAAEAQHRIAIQALRAEASEQPTENDELWIAANAMIQMAQASGTKEARIELQSSIARWMSGLMSGWSPKDASGPVSLSPDDAWRLEQFRSESLAFIAVAGNHGGCVNKAEVAIQLLRHRAMGYHGAPFIEFITAPDTQRPSDASMTTRMLQAAPTPNFARIATDGES